MHHIKITNPETGELESLLTIDRESGTAFIIGVEKLENIFKLTEIAQAAGVPVIICWTGKKQSEELESYGWTRCDELIIMRKELQ